MSKDDANSKNEDKSYEIQEKSFKKRGLGRGLITPWVQKLKIQRAPAVA